MTLAGVSQIHVPMRIGGPFSVLPGESADVRVSVDGIVDRLYVKEGDNIKQGDLVAVLSDRDVRTSFEKADAEIREARAKLRMLQAGSTIENIAVAQAGVANTSDQVKYAQRKLDRAQSMLDAGLLARSAFDEIEEQATATAGGLREAKARLNAVVNSVRPEQIEEAVAEIDRLETERRLIQHQLQSLQVVSPARGVVGTPARQLLQMLQQFVKKGDPIVRIYSFQTIKAQIMISEKEISAIRVGQPIELKARAYPEATFRGQVSFIANSANGSSTGGGVANLTATLGPPEGGAINQFFVNTEINNQALLLKRI